jgi:hypothetical protein
MKRLAPQLAALVFPALLLAYMSASAQTAGSGAAGATVVGTVFDSTGAAALRGASVQIVGAGDGALGRRLTALTDTLGRYSITGVPPGRYLAGFHHPRLDSLGLEIEDRAVTVADANVRLDLATPAPATYIALVCPDDRSGSLLVGHVRQTGSQAPLPDATVVATWTELDTTNVFVAQRNRERTIRTAPSGWFGLCGLPSEIAFLARAGGGADSSGYVRLSLPAGSVRVATFHVGGAVRVATAGDATTGTGQQVAWRGEAQLSGVVRDERGQPMPNARLTIWGTDSETTTDSRGRFWLGDLPGGTQTVEVRAIGFQPVERVMALSADDPATVDIALRERVTELEGVRVTATAVRARFAPFYERMRDAERGINHGYFITPQDMERRRPTLITNMFEGLAGIRVEQLPGSIDPKLKIVRGALREAGGYCLMTIYLDGIRVAGTAGGGHDGINQLIDPSTVAAMEVYPRPVSAPPHYQSLNGTCGVILIWTK